MKKIIYITNLTFHVKDMRPTPTLAKAEERKENGFPSPRFYSKMNKLDDTAEEVNTGGTFEFVIDVPPDLAEGVKNGEIELRLLHPIHTHAGKDVYEKLAQMQNKERRQLIHHGRVWHNE